MLLHISQGFLKSCNVPKWGVLLQFINLWMNLVLFANFYVKTYMAKKSGQDWICKGYRLIHSLKVDSPFVVVFPNHFKLISSYKSLTMIVSFTSYENVPPKLLQFCFKNGFLNFKIFWSRLYFLSYMFELSQSNLTPNTKLLHNANKIYICYHQISKSVIFGKCLTL